MVVPAIKQGGGFDIEFTGDDVAAKFRECQSAVNAGFAIHKALYDRNASQNGPIISARTGIHIGRPEEGQLQQDMSSVVASRLQSLGRADALCVSSSVINEIKPSSPVYVHSLGVHKLDFIPVTESVYYLFNEKPKFLAYQQLRFSRLISKPVDRVKIAYAGSIMLALILVTVALFYVSAEKKIINIELSGIRNFSVEKHEQEIDHISASLKTQINTVPGLKILTSRDKYSPDIKLVCGFQQEDGQMRLTWGMMVQGDTIQVAGGEITGKPASFASLERQFIQNIMDHLSDG